MKVLPPFFSLFLLNVAFAAPSANPGALSYGSELSPVNQTASSVGSHPIMFEKRVTAAQCISVAKAFYAHTSLEVANIFVTKTSNYIKSVCERHNKEECALWVDDVRDGFQLIFDLGYLYKVAAAAADARTAYINNAARSLQGNDVPSSLEDVLKMHGYSYESVENITLPSNGIKTRDNEPALMSLYMLKSVRQAGGERAHDYTIHNFEDGSAHLHVPYEHGNVSNSKAKRHDGAGVKISFKHKAIILATNADKKGASAALASKWLEYAESGNGEMFGFVEAMNEAVFYYRTIIEGNGFGEEYESVDDCGNLGQFVGTYLGPA